MSLIRQAFHTLQTYVPFEQVQRPNFVMETWNPLCIATNLADAVGRCFFSYLNSNTNYSSDTIFIKPGFSNVKYIREDCEKIPTVRRIMGTAAMAFAAAIPVGVAGAGLGMAVGAYLASFSPGDATTAQCFELATKTGFYCGTTLGGTLCGLGSAPGVPYVQRLFGKAAEAQTRANFPKVYQAVETPLNRFCNNVRTSVESLVGRFVAHLPAQKKD